MATTQEHINQAKTNISFLQNINNSIPNCFDWQVTVCFYSALHLVNSHISTFNLQYRRHTDVKAALNPFTIGSLMKLPETEYVSYLALQSLSRRARYLVNEKDGNLNTVTAFLTYEKHLVRAIKHLDILMQYFTEKYNYTLPIIEIECAELKNTVNVKHFIKKIKA